MSKSPFDYVASINKHEEMDVDSSYDSFLIPRHFSYFIDTVMYAHDAAKLMDRDFQYEYFFNSIKKKNRWTKWYKSDKVEQLKIIAEYYDCNYNEAQNVLKVLPQEAIDYINDWYKTIRKGE
jgi:hypothetical protein